ncbi:MAG: 50S ribosomal protein L5 [Candidatus Sericytochromatia bacterium]
MADNELKEQTVPRLRSRYDNELSPALMKQFSYKNKFQVPKLEKISVNIGIGEYVQTPKVLDSVIRDISTITGQKPIVIKAKKSIAGFRLRQGMPNGVKVTLRGKRMYEFLDKLISLNLPRIRDFRGLSSKSFDGRGNYTFGLKEQLIFPEINYDNIDKIRGLEITIVTTAKTDEEGKALLDSFGFPFKK